MPNERFVDGPQGKLHVSVSEHDADAALPIVFLHADLGTLRQWDALRSSLGERLTIAFDRRGHGTSDAPRDGVYEHATAAADVLAVADAAKLSRFALIGHSGGALTAWSFAAQHGDRVAGLLLEDPPVDPSTLPRGLIEQTLAAMRGADYLAVTEGYYRSIAGSNEATLAQVLADVRATPQATIVGCFESLGDFEPRRLAGRYTGHTLSVVQQQYDVTGALHRVPPGWPHANVEHTGHWIHLDAPDLFRAHVMRFLATLSS